MLVPLATSVMVPLETSVLFVVIHQNEMKCHYNASYNEDNPTSPRQDLHELYTALLHHCAESSLFENTMQCVVMDD